MCSTAPNNNNNLLDHLGLRSFAEWPQQPLTPRNDARGRRRPQSGNATVGRRERPGTADTPRSPLSGAGSPTKAQQRPPPSGDGSPFPPMLDEPAFFSHTYPPNLGFTNSGVPLSPDLVEQFLESQIEQEVFRGFGMPEDDEEVDLDEEGSWDDLNEEGGRSARSGGDSHRSGRGSFVAPLQQSGNMNDMMKALQPQSPTKRMSFFAQGLSSAWQGTLNAAQRGPGGGRPSIFGGQLGMPPMRATRRESTLGGQLSMGLQGRLHPNALNSKRSISPKSRFSKRPTEADHSWENSPNSRLRTTLLRHGGVQIGRKTVARGDSPKKEAETAPAQKWRWYKAWKCKTLGLPLLEIKERPEVDPEVAKSEEQTEDGTGRKNSNSDDGTGEAGGDTKGKKQGTWFNDDTEVIHPVAHTDSDGQQKATSPSAKSVQAAALAKSMGRDGKEIRMDLYQCGGFGKTGSMSLPEWLASGGVRGGERGSVLESVAETDESKTKGKSKTVVAPPQPPDEPQAQAEAKPSDRPDNAAESAAQSGDGGEKESAPSETYALLWTDDVIQSTLAAHKLDVHSIDSQQLETLTRELRNGEAYLATGDDGVLTRMVDAVELRICNSSGNVLVERPVAGNEVVSSRNDRPWQGEDDWDIGRLLCTVSKGEEETWDAAVRALTDRHVNINLMRVVKPAFTQWRKMPDNPNILLPSACRVIIIDMAIVADEARICQARGVLDGLVLGWENPATSPAFRSESGIRVGRMKTVMPYTEELVARVMRQSGAHLPSSIWDSSLPLKRLGRGSDASDSVSVKSVGFKDGPKGAGLWAALAHELTCGKSRLMSKPDGMIVRKLDYICVRIRGDGGRVLVVITQVEPELAELPQARREPGSPDVWSAAFRIIRGLEVPLQGRSIELHLNPKVKWQPADNQEEFPGLSNLSRIIYVDGNLNVQDRNKDKRNTTKRVTMKDENMVHPRKVGTFQEWAKRNAEREKAEQAHLEHVHEMDKARAIAAKSTPGMSVTFGNNLQEMLTGGALHKDDPEGSVLHSDMKKQLAPTFESSREDMELLMLAKKYQVTVVQADRLKRRFDSIANVKGASSGMGHIDEAEFVSLMQDLLNIRDKYDFSMSRLREFWRIVDLDNSGTIDFEEFLCFSVRYFGAEITGKQAGNKKGGSCVSAVDTVPTRSWDQKRLREFELFDIYMNGDLEMHACRKKTMAQNNTALGKDGKAR